MAQQRLHQRFACDLPVLVAHGERSFELKARDISLGGLSCEMSEPLPYNEEVSVRFRLPAMKVDTECQMRVRWQRDGSVGLQFGSLRALEVWALNQLLRSLASSSAG